MNYLAFYWTFPVNWAGFTALPRNADEAAKVSKTIRYQVARVRRWVKEDNGVLLAETAFMDHQPDRGTDAIKAEIEKVLKQAADLNGQVILVDFAAAYGWRPHGPLSSIISNAKRCVLLPPEPTIVDGEWWDPVGHFREWREEDERNLASKKTKRDALAAAIANLKAAGSSYEAVANRLNDQGLKTISGRVWSADNVRKFLKIS